jgi:hypothetical protein
MNPAYNPYLIERRYRQASLLRACSWVLHFILANERYRENISIYEELEKAIEILEEIKPGSYKNIFRDDDIDFQTGQEHAPDTQAPVTDPEISNFVSSISGYYPKFIKHYPELMNLLALKGEVSCKR